MGILNKVISLKFKYTFTRDHILQISKKYGILFNRFIFLGGWGATFSKKLCSFKIKTRFEEHKNNFSYSYMTFFLFVGKRSSNFKMKLSTYLLKTFLLSIFTGVVLNKILFNMNFIHGFWFSKDSAQIQFINLKHVILSIVLHFNYYIFRSFIFLSSKKTFCESLKWKFLSK